MGGFETKMTMRMYGSAAGMLIVAGQACAQVPAAGGLEDIVVTAERRAVGQQSVPLAISALSADALAERQVSTLEDMNALVPTLIVDPVPGGPSAGKIYIRGVGTDNPVFTGDSAVGIYFDDVFVARAQGVLFDFFDLERIEVLRGPQGTLYGRNSSAGAVKIVTRKPEMGENSFEGTAGYGSYNQVELRGAANVAVADTLAARFALSYGRRDGLQRNVLDGSPALDKNAFGARAHLRWIPSSDWNILLSGNYFRDTSLPSGAVDFSRTTEPDLLRFASANLPIQQSTDSKGLTIDVVHDGPVVSFRSLTGYRKLDWGVRSDVDGTEQNRFEPHQFLNQKQLSQEFTFSGKSEKADWLIGAYYFHEKQSFLWDLNVFENLGIPQQYTIFSQDTDALALFSQATLRISDVFSVTGGVRYSWEKKDFVAEGFFQAADAPIPEFGQPPLASAPQFEFADAKDFEDITWRIALDAQLNEATLVYLSASKGFRSGGFNGGARSLAEAAAPPFRSENVFTYELGLKADFANRRLRTNLALFTSDFENLQEASLRGEGEFTTETADARIRGFEFEVFARPNERIDMSLGGSFLDSRILSGAQEGNRVKYTPNFQSAFNLGYSLLSNDAGELRINTTVTYTDSYFINVENISTVAIPSFWNWDARIGWKARQGRWFVEGSVRNITDERRPTHGFDLNVGPPPPLGPLSRVLFPNEPRTFLFTVGIRL